MSHVQETPSAKGQAQTYELEGQLLEVCDCKVICPCWVGEDPDGGTCEGVVAWTISRGEIQGVDVSGLTFAVVAHIPGNVLQGNWQAIATVDDKATPEQEEKLLQVFTGQLGGPVADLAGLVGEVVALERVPITTSIEEGKGHLQIGGLVESSLEPYQGATGISTTLSETVFSTIPGSPAYVSKASYYKRHTSQYGIADVDIQGHNAVQGHFHFVA